MSTAPLTGTRALTVPVKLKRRRLLTPVGRISLGFVAVVVVAAALAPLIAPYDPDHVDLQN
ncbi:hypothetical protein BMH30_14110, partial [Leucobacter sp. OLES1]